VRLEQCHRVITRTYAVVVPHPDFIRPACEHTRLRLRNQTGALLVGAVINRAGCCHPCSVRSVTELGLHLHLLDQLERHPATGRLVIAQASVIRPTGPTKGHG
jgi:hypothetical protein